MQKIVIHGPGSYDKLLLEEHPTPKPAPGEVLVRTSAIGVNYADCVVRMGLYSSAKKYVGWPITPGFEFAGRVEALGEGVSDLNLGDEVFGVTRFNAYATHVVAPRRQIYRRPAFLSAEQAAAFPSVYLTAYYPLCEMLRVRAGQAILVHSAAGGVGSALVQIGKILGCKVVGVVGRSHKTETVRALGADHVIDKSTEDLWATAERFAPEGYDIVLDANGVETLEQSYEHLAAGGKLVVYGFHTMLPRVGGRPNYLKLALSYLKTPKFNPLELTTRNKSVLAFNLSFLFHRAEVLHEAMDVMLGWMGEGKLKPPQVSTFKLHEVAKAHAALESGETVGKLVLIP